MTFTLPPPLKRRFQGIEVGKGEKRVAERSQTLAMPKEGKAPWAKKEGLPKTCARKKLMVEERDLRALSNKKVERSSAKVA